MYEHCTAPHGPVFVRFDRQGRCPRTQASRQQNSGPLTSHSDRHAGQWLPTLYHSPPDGCSCRLMSASLFRPQPHASSYSHKPTALTTPH